LYGCVKGSQQDTHTSPMLNNCIENRAIKSYLAATILTLYVYGNCVTCCRAIGKQQHCFVSSSRAPCCYPSSRFFNGLSSTTLQYRAGSKWIDMTRSCAMFDMLTSHDVSSGLLQLQRPCSVGLFEWNEFSHVIFAHLIERLWSPSRPHRALSLLFAKGQIAWPFIDNSSPLMGSAALHGAVWHSIYLNSFASSRLRKPAQVLCNTICQDTHLPDCLRRQCYHGCGHGYLAIEMNVSYYSPCTGPRRGAIDINVVDLRRAEHTCDLTFDSSCPGDDERRGYFTACVDGVYHHYFKYAAPPLAPAITQENICWEHTQPLSCDGTVCASCVCESMRNLSIRQAKTDVMCATERTPPPPHVPPLAVITTSEMMN